MNMRRILILFALLPWMSMTSHAQDYEHYVDVTVGAGLHSVQFAPQSGEHTPGMGTELRAEYRYVINEHWLAGAGLGFSWYNGKSLYDDLRLSHMAVDAENGEPYEYRIIFSDWREKQHIVNLEIPFEAYYRHKINSIWSAIAGAGFKFYVPIVKDYSVQDGTLQTKGYFEKFTNVEYENLPQHGFFTKENCEGEASLKKFGVATMVDLGALRSFKHSDMSLYVGAYFGFGFTNLADKHAPLFDGKDYVGVVSSDHVDKVHLLSAGLKVGVTFGFPRIFPLPEMQHEMECDNEDLEAIEAEIKKFEKDEIEEVLRIARQLAQQEEERKAKEYANVKEVVKWLNKNVKVEFKLGEAVVEMNDEIQNYINDLTHYIKTTPGRKVTIWGHTCNLGSEAKNIELGMQRAEAMRKLLIKAGCPINRVMARSKGSSEPLVPNTSEANRQMNRRIEIIVK